MPLPGDLLLRDAEEAVRLIALDFVAQAREAAPRCLDPKDSEGLHDFRVSIRRLRSTVSAWKGLLRGVVEKRDRRTLAGFQKRTGASRDAEVALEWLEEQVGKLEPEHGPGYEWVEARLRSAGSSSDLEERHTLGAPAPSPASEEDAPRSGDHSRGASNTPSGDAHRTVCDEFAGWADGFLSRLENPVPAGAVRSPYAQALAERLDSVAHRLEVRVDDLGDDRKRGPHRVRIACKRLRYLVEPARAESDVAVSVVERCKQLQNVLGTLNDANVLDDLLKVYVEAVSTTSEPGVLALCRLNAARADASYRSFRVDWLEGAGMQTLLDEVFALVRELRG